MEYRMVGPLTHEEFYSREFMDKVLSATDTIEVLYSVVKELQDLPNSEVYLSLLKERDLWGEIISVNKFEELKKRKENLENILNSGLILTSTEVKGFADKGMKINKKNINYNPYSFSSPIVNMSFLKSHPVLASSFSKSGLKLLHDFIYSAEIHDFDCYGEGNDPGRNWMSKITFDLDYDGGFMLFTFDDTFRRHFNFAKYKAFLSK